jgi:hypothetical protein
VPEMHPLRQIAWLLLLLAPAVHAGSKQKQAYVLKPDQTVDLDAPKLFTAQQACENWALAAGLQSLLEKQNVKLDQSFWVMRLNYGELCVQQIPSMEQLADVVNKEFVLDDGRHVRLELQFDPGAPTNIDRLLAGLKREEPSLLLWHGHPYYLIGATYDERVGRDGTRIFEVKELRLAETFARTPGVTFQKGRDNLDEIQGILTVSVTQL